MFVEIYQHFKQFSSQRISHVSQVEKEEWVFYCESFIFKLSCSFELLLHRYHSINNTFNLSNLMSFSWPWVSLTKLDKRVTFKNKIPLFLNNLNFPSRNAREWMDPQMHLRVARWLVEIWRPVKQRLGRKVRMPTMACSDESTHRKYIYIRWL